MHGDHHALRITGDGGDEEVLHQPAILRCSGLELRRAAAIDQLRIDRLVALELLQQIKRPEADALVLDIDDRAVVGLKRIFRFQLDQLVGPDDLEIRAEWTDLAVDLAAHFTADDRHDAADAMADLAGTDDRIDMGGDGEDVFCLDHGGHRQRAPKVASPSQSPWVITSPIGRGEGQTTPCSYCAICCGSQVASSGNEIRITSRIRSVATKGSTPLKMVAKETSFTTLLITNTFMPTGGWIRPSSTVITMMTPNQIGSKPRWVTTGKMIGTVRMIIAIASIRHPSTMYMSIITASTP